jgi:hypothetical protein
MIRMNLMYYDNVTKIYNDNPLVQEIAAPLAALLGGSAIVDYDKANDVDICVPAAKDEDNWHLLGFRRICEGDDKYPEIDHERLLAVYEKEPEEGKHKKKINVIIVGDMYWPAYVASITAMIYRPDLYDTREKRIELHKGWCQVIRCMLRTGAKGFGPSYMQMHKEEPCDVHPDSLPVHWWAD